LEINNEDDKTQIDHVNLCCICFCYFYATSLFGLMDVKACKCHCNHLAWMLGFEYTPSSEGEKQQLALVIENLNNMAK
tara:strand:+ start:17149 stop:17382 length:234 start_codon:yes stop_codon:yes gene_type:complete